MALKNRKRAASKAAGAAGKKQRTSPVAKKCALIAPTIRDAASLTLPDRKIISDRLVHVFGTYKEERSPFQVSISKMVGSTLKVTQTTLEGSISEAQAKHGQENSTLGELSAVNDAANAASEAAAQGLADSKNAMRSLNGAFKDAKSALHGLEAAAKNAEADNLATSAKQEKLNALIKEFFTTVKEGTLNKGLSSSSAYAGKFLAKNFGSSLEREFIACVVRTFAKPASSWRTFDHIVDKQLEANLKHIVADLASELEGMAAGKATSATNIEAATAAVAAAKDQMHAAVEACTAASNAAKQAKAAARAAGAAAKTQSQHVEKSTAAVETAEHALSSFKEGPLAAYTEVEAHVKPPPAPEPEESAPVDAAMAPAPAPAARAAPSVLPSPGVLSWVAQKSGLARSPQVGESPRTL